MLVGISSTVSTCRIQLKACTSMEPSYVSEMRTHKHLSLCLQGDLQAAPADAAVFAKVRGGHFTVFTLDGLQGPPDSPAPATPKTDSTCPWCHSGVTLPGVPSSVRDLPWLLIIHCLLLCPAGPGRPPLSHFCSEMLVLTSDWPHYQCRLGILDLLISTCTAQLGHVSPHLLPRSRISCCSPQVSCMSGAPDQVSDDVRFLFLVCMSLALPQPAAHAAAPSPANSDEEVPIPRFSHRTALVSCYGDADVSLPRPSVSRLFSSTSSPIVCSQPAP
jgi:hypothetical protein